VKKLVVALCVLAMVIATTLSVGAAPSKVYNIKFAYTANAIDPNDSPDVKYAVVFKKLVEDASKGSVTVTLFPAGQLGSAAENVQGVIGGTIDMTIVNVNLLNNVYNKTMVLGIPGVFASVEECNAVINGSWGLALSDELKAKTGIRILNMGSNGFRCFTNNKHEVKTVKDAKGLTFRVMESPVSIKMVEALGAKAVPMAGSEMYVAMQNGVVDGQENPVLNILQDHTYEVQKYLVLDEHLASIMTYLINDKLYNGLPEDLRAIVKSAGAAAVKEADLVIKTKNENGVKVLESKGMKVYKPTESELADWHDVVFQPTQKYVRTQLGDATVDGLIKAVQDFRNKK
jgi:tripartite ATP-independent transporter DctP family solute receptor